MITANRPGTSMYSIFFLCDQSFINNFPTMTPIDSILARLLALHPKRIDLSLDRMWRILAALDVTRAESTAQPSSLRALAESEGERVRCARALSDNRHEGAPAERAVLAFTRGRGTSHRCVWAFRLPILDADGHLVFETIVGLSDSRGLVTMDDALEQTAALTQINIVLNWFEELKLRVPTTKQ